MLNLLSVRFAKFVPFDAPRRRFNAQVCSERALGATAGQRGTHRTLHLRVWHDPFDVRQPCVQHTPISHPFHAISIVAQALESTECVATQSDGIYVNYKHRRCVLAARRDSQKLELVDRHGQ